MNVHVPRGVDAPIPEAHSLVPAEIRPQPRYSKQPCKAEEAEGEVPLLSLAGIPGQKVASEQKD